MPQLLRQVMPQLLFYLEPDGDSDGCSKEDMELDWGCVAVYSCRDRRSEPL